MKLKKSEIQSAIATTIICIIILLILIFCGMTAHKNEMDEGVMVSLGYAEDGFGESMPNPTPAPEAAPVPTPTPQFAFFVNLPQYIKESYRRYLENKMREQWDFSGVPIQIYFRQK